MNESEVLDFWFDRVMESPALLIVVPDWLMRRHPGFLEDILKDCPLALRYATKSRLTYDMCVYCVWKAPSTYTYVPEKFRTGYLAIVAVSSNAMVLRDIEPELRTVTACNIAMRQLQGRFGSYRGSEIYFALIRDHYFDIESK